MHHDNERIKDDIIMEFTKTIELFGLSTLEARLFAYLYLTNKPLTLDEMSQALGKSKTTMSNGIRNLSELNLVSLVWKKGTRKDLYQANSQLFSSFLSTYVSKWLEMVSHQKTSLEEINQSIDLKENSYNRNPELSELTDRLNDMIEFHQLLEELFKDVKKNVRK